MLTMNEKLQKTSKKHGVRVFSFDLPAGETCLNADACKVGCFGKQGWYVKRCVKNHLARNLEISRSLDFKDRMKQAIRWRRAEVVRIHSTGDFYSPLYLDKWLDIVSEVPIHFYTYTKQVSWLRSVKLPLNLTVVYSLGGKEDHLIKLDQDKHSKVFATEQELQKDGYANASGDDFVVFQEDRIGIVYHGLRKYRNTGFSASLVSDQYGGLIISAKGTPGANGAGELQLKGNGGGQIILCRENI